MDPPSMWFERHGHGEVVNRVTFMIRTKANKLESIETKSILRRNHVKTIFSNETIPSSSSSSSWSSSSMCALIVARAFKMPSSAHLKFGFLLFTQGLILPSPGLVSARKSQSNSMLGGFLKENKGVDQQKKLRGTMEDSSNRTRGSTAKNHFG